MPSLAPIDSTAILTWPSPATTSTKHPTLSLSPFEYKDKFMPKIPQKFLLSLSLITAFWWFCKSHYCVETGLRRLAVRQAGDGGLNGDVEGYLDVVLSRNIRVAELVIWASEDRENWTTRGAADHGTSNTGAPLHGEMYSGITFWCCFVPHVPELRFSYTDMLVAPVQMVIAQTQFTRWLVHPRIQSMYLRNFPITNLFWSPPLTEHWCSARPSKTSNITTNHGSPQHRRTLHGKTHSQSTCCISFSWYSRIVFFWSRHVGPVQTAVLLKYDISMKRTLRCYETTSISAHSNFTSDIPSGCLQKDVASSTSFSASKSPKFPSGLGVSLPENSRDSRTCSSYSSSPIAGPHRKKGTVNTQLQSKLSWDVDSMTTKSIVWWSSSRGSRRELGLRVMEG